jgi:uncharacterized protein
MVDRMCIVSRAVKPEAELIRFVLSPDGTVVPDLKRKLPGRGVWVSASHTTVSEAMKRNLFARGFGEPAKAPDDLADRAGQLLRTEAVGMLSLARKAGNAVSGFVKVETVLNKAKVRMLLHSPNAAADGIRKLDRLAGPEVLISSDFLAAELNLAFASENVIHAAILAGGLAEKLNVQLQRMTRYYQV